MRSTFDFSPLFRSTVGFDRIPSLFEMASRIDQSSLGYPPYDIERIDDDAYRISLAVAGFAADDLDIEMQANSIVVTGSEPADKGERDFLHRGIAARSFRRAFQLADDVRVDGARLENGMLHIDFVRELPAEKKPRRIEISTSKPTPITSRARKLVESIKKAA